MIHVYPVWISDFFSAFSKTMEAGTHGFLPSSTTSELDGGKCVLGGGH